MVRAAYVAAMTPFIQISWIISFLVLFIVSGGYYNKKTNQNKNILYFLDKIILPRTSFNV